MIRLAKLPEIHDILNVTNSCAAFMIEHGIYQWNEHYPSKNAFLKDIERSELYVLDNGEGIIGTIVTSTLMDKEYIPVQWLTPNYKNLYIHRLAIDPSQQGRGYAQKLMSFAEDKAKKNGLVSVRLDTFSQNKRNQRFYEARGYNKLSDIYFPKQSEHPFHCYELIL
ncbi:GNAT family N-acetyltransferase [Maribacter luteus]|uniref:GNAT family N-acetyltransferase n=1 Tax=Maribacter luteus TaxID=2594478 RepID=UPI00249142AD|nr:GNAT family N-acetyltransferase [Maribacter luteus]